MSNWQQFKNGLLTALAIGAIAIVLWLAYIGSVAFYHSLAPSLASRLVIRAEAEQGSQALRDYTLALWLQPNDRTTRSKVAALALRSGLVEQARGATAGHEYDSAQLTTVAMLVALEDDDQAKAKQLSGRLDQRAWPVQVTLAALGEPSTEPVLMTPVGIAGELYTLRLSQATKRQLAKAEPDTLTYFQLQTALELETVPLTDEQRRNAQNWLKKAIILAPANTDLRKQLRDVSQQLNDQPTVNEQEQRIDQLESGKV